MEPVHTNHPNSFFVQYSSELNENDMGVIEQACEDVVSALDEHSADDDNGMRVRHPAKVEVGAIYLAPYGDHEDEEDKGKDNDEDEEEEKAPVQYYRARVDR